MIFCALRRGAIAALFFGVSATAFAQTSNNIPTEIPHSLQRTMASLILTDASTISGAVHFC